MVVGANGRSPLHLTGGTPRTSTDCSSNKSQKIMKKPKIIIGANGRSPLHSIDGSRINSTKGLSCISTNFSSITFPNGISRPKNCYWFEQPFALAICHGLIPYIHQFFVHYIPKRNQPTKKLLLRRTAVRPYLLQNFHLLSLSC